MNTAKKHQGSCHNLIPIVDPTQSVMSLFTDISKRTDNRLVKYYPCSNRPVICEQCNTCHWLYNLVEHYSKSHPCLECLEQIPPEERTFILSKKL
jgi:hypothetical protein